MSSGVPGRCAAGAIGRLKGRRRRQLPPSRPDRAAGNRDRSVAEPVAAGACRSPRERCYGDGKGAEPAAQRAGLRPQRSRAAVFTGHAGHLLQLVRLADSARRCLLRGLSEASRVPLNRSCSCGGSFAATEGALPLASQQRRRAAPPAHCRPAALLRAPLPCPQEAAAGAAHAGLRLPVRCVLACTHALLHCSAASTFNVVGVVGSCIRTAACRTPIMSCSQLPCLPLQAARRPR